MRTSVFVGMSLDGFIARRDDGLDFLDGPAGAPAPVEDHGFEPFFASVDVLVMGRRSFEKVLSMGQWYYGEKPVVVLTGRPLAVPPERAKTVETMSGEPAEVLQRLEARGFRHVYVDGGLTVQRFLAAGLIDRLTLSRLPVLIGRGIPLFGALPEDVWLRHVATREFPSGLVQSEYEVRRDVPALESGPRTG